MGKFKPILPVLYLVVWAFLTQTAVWAENLEKGFYLFLDNKPSEAIPFLEKALYEYPTNPEIYTSLSSAYVQISKYDSAIALLTKALDKGYVERYLTLGQIGAIYSISGNFTDAVKLYSQALDAKPDDSWSLYQRGNNFFFKRDFPSAINDYEKFLLIAPKDPQSPEVARMIAYLKEELKNQEVAKKLEEDQKLAEAARLKQLELDKQIADEKQRKDDEARKKLMDDIYASLNDASNEQTNLSAGTEDVKNKPADVIRED